MNASSSPLSPLSVSPSASSAPRVRRGGPWIYSLTSVCFLFGGLLAAQLRGIQKMNDSRENAQKAQIKESQRAVLARRQFAAERQKSAALQVQLASLKTKLSTGTLTTKAQMDALNAQLSQLQAVSGLTPVSGAGVVVILDDASPAAQSGPLANAYNPQALLVHDYDLQQIVNELRNVRADAISINGTRITGYTPIRCAGNPILINWETLTPPYRIEAVGDPAKLEKGLTYAGGIIDSLQRNTPLIVKVQRSARLTLPAAESLPRLRASRLDGARLSAR